MTLTDLYRKALERLQVVSATDSAAPEDTQLIADKYVAVYDMLRGKRLVAWAVDDAVPDYAVMPLTSMLAWASATEFGADSNALAAEGSIGLPTSSLAERQLREQIARPYVAYPAQSEYF